MVKIVEIAAGSYTVKQIKEVIDPISGEPKVDNKTGQIVTETVIRKANVLYALGDNGRVYRMKDATGKLCKGPKGRRWEYLPGLPSIPEKPGEHAA